MNSVLPYSSQKKIACFVLLFNGWVSVKTYEDAFWNLCLEKPLDSNIHPMLSPLCSNIQMVRAMALKKLLNNAFV